MSKKWDTAKDSGAAFCIDESKPRKECVGTLNLRFGHWEVVIGRENEISWLDHRRWIKVYNFKERFEPKEGRTVSFTFVHAYYLGFAGSSPIELAFDVGKLE